MPARPRPARTSTAKDFSIDRLLASLTALLVIAVVLFLVVRNAPIADRNYVVFIRFLLSFSMAVFGATVPGFLNLSWKGGGLLVRAGGALALFAFTLFWTPNVVKSSDANPRMEIQSVPREYEETRRVPLGAEIVLKAINIPENTQLLWSVIGKGRVSPTTGTVVTFFAPTDPADIGAVTVEVVTEGRYQKDVIRFDLQIVAPFVISQRHYEGAKPNVPSYR